MRPVLKAWRSVVIWNMLQRSTKLMPRRTDRFLSLQVCCVCKSESAALSSNLSYYKTCCRTTLIKCCARRTDRFLSLHMRCMRKTEPVRVEAGQWSHQAQSLLLRVRSPIWLHCTCPLNQKESTYWAASNLCLVSRITIETKPFQLCCTWIEHFGCDPNECSLPAQSSRAINLCVFLELQQKGKTWYGSFLSVSGSTFGWQKKLTIRTCTHGCSDRFWSWCLCPFYVLLAESDYSSKQQKKHITSMRKFKDCFKHLETISNFSLCSRGGQGPIILCIVIWSILFGDSNFVVRNTFVPPTALRTHWDNTLCGTSEFVCLWQYRNTIFQRPVCLQPTWFFRNP